METNTITKIAELKDSIATNLEAYRKKQVAQKADMNVGQFGTESEYSIIGLIGGVKNILTDISYLVKAHNVFIKLSTYTERNNIHSNLSNLNTYLQNAQHPQIANSLDTLKIILRSYNLRSDRDRYLEFSNEVDNLRKTAISLETVISDVKEKVIESESVHQEIVNTKEKYDKAFSQLESEKDTLSQTVENFTDEFGTFKALATTAKENETTIAEKLEAAKESEDAFDEFIAKIDEREKQLVAQEKSTTEYTDKLQYYTGEHGIKLNNVQELIDKAKMALEYSTAKGMSAAFQTQHDKASKKWGQWGWLIAAGVFITITIVLGIWIVGGWGINSDDKITSLVGRLSMIPFTLLGAVFCAKQYTKQRNIAEDYAYKTVLSKSIVAFSEELRSKDPERYAEYISTVLREIHQDPLRKRSNDKDEVSIKDSTGLVGKIIELLKTIDK
jgi:hypothetical protein